MNILWDWNGTLLDDVELSISAINKTLLEFKINSIDIDTYKKYYRFPISDFYLDIGFDFKSYSKSQITERFFLHYNLEFSKFNLFHNSKKKLLDKISSLGHNNYILSAREQQNLDYELNLLNLNYFFLKVYGASSSLRISKEQRLIQLISEKKIALSDTLLIGDTISDFELAKKTGIRCILFSGGHQSKERLSFMPNVMLVDSLESIIELI